MISAPAHASKKVMLRGSLPGSLAMLWDDSQGCYARQRDPRLRRESFILAAPRKVESVAGARQFPAPAAPQI